MNKQEEMKTLKDEPLYYAKIKRFEHLSPIEYFWNYSKNTGRFSLGVKRHSSQSFTKMSKSEWNELGVNDTNAHFEEVVIMNAQDEIKALKQRITELEQQVEQEKDFPQYEEDYWYVDNDTEVRGMVWYGDDYDQGRVSINNVFKTKDQAEFAAEKLRVEAELRKFSRPFKYGDWNFEILWNNHENNIELDWSGYVVRQSVIYFESGEVAEKAIESVGAERIKKYIFGMED